jgi:KAP family P-loop domain
LAINNNLDPFVQDELANFKFYQDNPIRYAKEDILGYKYIVDNLVYILKNSIKTPINIGLYGKWGVGKSSILYLLEERLQQEDDLSMKFKFVYIDVWGLSSQSLKQELLLEFNNNVRKKSLHKAQTNQQITEKDIIERLYYTKQIDEDQKITLKTFIKKAKWYFPLYVLPLGVAAFAYIYDPKNTKNLTTITIIGSLITSVLAPSLFNLVDRFEKKIGMKVTIPKTESSQEFRKIFEEILYKVINKEDNQILVIAIDNLDRCDDDTVVEILGMIKTFLSIEGCVFLIACDDDAIIKHLASARKIQNNEYYNDANDFLEKMFQLVLRVPSINEQQLVTFVNYLANTLQIQIGPQVSEILIASKMYNPRKILRILNRLALLLKLAVDEEKIGNVSKGLVTQNTQFLSKLLVIRERYPAFYKELVLNSRLLEKFDRYLVGEEEQSKRIQEIIRNDDPQSSELVYFLRATMGINSPNVSAFLRLFEEKLDKTVSEADILVSETIDKGIGYAKQAIENMSSNEYKVIYTRALMNYLDKCIQREDFQAAADCLNIMLNISDQVPQELRQVFLFQFGRYISQNQMSKFISNNSFDVKKIFSLISQMPYGLDKYVITFLINNLVYDQTFNHIILQGFIDYKDVLNNDAYVDKINEKIEGLFLDNKDGDALKALNMMIKDTDIRRMFVRPFLISRMIERIDVNEPINIIESKAEIFLLTKESMSLEAKSFFLGKVGELLKVHKKGLSKDFLLVFKWLNRFTVDDYTTETASCIYDCSMPFIDKVDYSNKKRIMEPMISLSSHIDENKRRDLADNILKRIDNNKDFINIVEHTKKNDKLKSLNEMLLNVDKILVTKEIDLELLTYMLKNSTEEKKEKIGDFCIAIIQSRKRLERFKYTAGFSIRFFKESYLFFPITMTERICQTFMNAAKDRIQEAITAINHAEAKSEFPKEQFKDIQHTSLMNEQLGKKTSEESKKADILIRSAILYLVPSFYVFDRVDDIIKNQIIDMVINILAYHKELFNLKESLMVFVKCIEDEYLDKYISLRRRLDHTPVPTSCMDMIIMQLISKLRSELDTTDETSILLTENDRINDQSDIIYLFEFLTKLCEYKKMNEVNKNSFVKCILDQISKERTPMVQRISLAYLTRINLTEKEKEEIKNTILKVENESTNHDIKLVYEEAIKQMK